MRVGNILIIKNVIDINIYIYNKDVYVFLPIALIFKVVFSSKND